MIAYLDGVVREIKTDSIVVEVNGVGYGVKVTTTEAANLKNDQRTKLYVYEHIREDLHDLYGFAAVSGKQLFELLLSVKNVGPKVALAVMSIDNEPVLRAAIAGGNIELIKSAKNVGKRAAEQIIVELRDKVGLVAGEGAEGIVNRSGVDNADEAVQALMSLGFSNIEASKALLNVDKTLPVEEKVKQALKVKK